MTENIAEITADNLRAEFLNATTNWQRWKILNQALQWALDGSELLDWHRQQEQARQQAVPMPAASIKYTCAVKVYGDMTKCCTCGLAWGTNDPDPPKCGGHT